MGWNVRLPNTFPARFSAVAREAANNLGRPILLSSHHSLGDARHIAEEFRHFRWCLRRLEEDSELAQIERSCRLRASIGSDLLVYITAYTRPDLERLNPHLADCFSAD